MFMTLVLGLTGGIATGKSTVAKMFEDRNITVIDTDKIARELLNKGTESYNEVIKFFTSDILLTNGEINRKKLGRIIFANAQKREKLNSIVHPRVLKIVDAEIQKSRDKDEKVIVLDVPLLFESGFDKKVDKTIVVYTSHKAQVKRLMERDLIKREYAEMKINAQMSINDKVDIADYVINNSLSILNTKKDFNKILEELEV